MQFNNTPKGSKNAKAAAALRNAKIGSSYEAFPWERKMAELLPVPNSSSFLSLLMLPQAADESQTRYLCLEDTLARANAWLVSSQSSGVPIVHKNVQIEPLLTKVRQINKILLETLPIFNLLIYIYRQKNAY
jgi:hypothetical protein